MGFGWAKVGVKCRWVGCERPDGYYPAKAKRLSRDQIYTIREILSDPRVPDVIGCYVDGVVNEIHPSHKLEYGYMLAGFRPLITLEDDISMFTALTNMSPIERLDRLKEMMDQ